jgi:hypothetical protein
VTWIFFTTNLFLDDSDKLYILQNTNTEGIQIQDKYGIRMVDLA